MKSVCFLFFSFHVNNKAWRLYEEDLLMELLDENLDPNEHSADEVKKVIQIALCALNHLLQGLPCPMWSFCC